MPDFYIIKKRFAAFVYIFAAFFAALAGVRAPAAQEPKVMLGIDVLESRNFAPIAGKRVGLLTHPAGVNRFGTSTIDILRPGARNLRQREG